MHVLVWSQARKRVVFLVVAALLFLASFGRHLAATIDEARSPTASVDRPALRKVVDAKNGSLRASEAQQISTLVLFFGNHNGRHSNQLKGQLQALELGRRVLRQLCTRASSRAEAVGGGLRVVVVLPPFEQDKKLYPFESLYDVPSLRKAFASLPLGEDARLLEECHALFTSLSLDLLAADEVKDWLKATATTDGRGRRPWRLGAAKKGPLMCLPRAGIPSRIRRPVPRALLEAQKEALRLTKEQSAGQNSGGSADALPAGSSSFTAMCGRNIPLTSRDLTDVAGAVAGDGVVQKLLFRPPSATRGGGVAVVYAFETIYYDNVCPDLGWAWRALRPSEQLLATWPFFTRSKERASWPSRIRQAEATPSNTGRIGEPRPTATRFRRQRDLPPLAIGGDDGGGDALPYAVVHVRALEGTCEQRLRRLFENRAKEPRLHWPLAVGRKEDVLHDDWVPLWQCGLGSWAVLRRRLLQAIAAQFRPEPWEATQLLQHLYISADTSASLQRLAGDALREDAVPPGEARFVVLAPHPEAGATVVTNSVMALMLPHDHTVPGMLLDFWRAVEADVFVGNGASTLTRNICYVRYFRRMAWRGSSNSTAETRRDTNEDCFEVPIPW